MQGNFNKMIPAQKIDLLIQDQHKNPEDIATHQLLQISDEYSPDPFDFQPHLTKSNSIHSQRLERPFNQSKNLDQKNQDAGKFLKTQIQWRKASSRFITGEEVCVMKPEKVVNLSSFIILDGQGISEKEEIRKQGIEENKFSTTLRPSNNIIAYIRRRNLSSIRQQSNDLVRISYGLNNRSPKRAASPMQRMNMSCQLKKKDDERSPQKNKIIEAERINSVSPQIRCTSPTFRNKRVTNYLRYRIGRS